MKYLLLYVSLFLISSNLNAENKIHLENLSYYELINYKIDDKSIDLDRSFKHIFFKKIKNKRDNYLLLSVNAVFYGLYSLQYKTYESAYGVQDKKYMSNGFITYGILMNIGLLGLRFIDD